VEAKTHSASGLSVVVKVGTIEVLFSYGRAWAVVETLEGRRWGFRRDSFESRTTEKHIASFFEGTMEEKRVGASYFEAFYHLELIRALEEETFDLQLKRLEAGNGSDE
jgi:hypothetical protein